MYPGDNGCMTNPTHPLWQLVSLTRRTLDASPQLTRRQALTAVANYLDRAERDAHQTEPCDPNQRWTNPLGGDA